VKKKGSKGHGPVLTFVSNTASTLANTSLSDGLQYMTDLIELID